MKATLIVIAMAVRSTLAATYYVAPTGADTHPGTLAQPFLSIQKAADIVVPGDIVHVCPGTYAESVSIKRSGEPGNPVVFEGERAANGKWLTIVDRSQSAGRWMPAPEIGHGVFKTNALGFVPHSMTLHEKQLARVSDTLMKGEKGIAYFKLPAKAMIKEDYVEAEMDFWDAVEILYGCRDGVTYIRFRNGDDPNKYVLKAAPAGGGFALTGKSHVVIRRFLIRGAEDSVVIEGDGAHHNTVENNFLMNGHNRVVLTKGASFNLVRNNEMTLDYYGYNDPGAWGTSHQTHQTACRTHVYRVFKFVVGPSSSDDHGVLMERGGEANEVCGNHIYAGLIGISCGQQNRPNIHHNVIHNMSSIGILTSEDGGKGPHNGEFHDNLVYDCNINLRIHHYNRAKDNQRREFHYRNRFYEPEGIGESIYVHWLDDKWYPETEHPEIWLYHNSFAGGQRAMSPSNFSLKGGGLQRTRMLNNIFSSPVFFYASETFIGSPAMIELCDYNWIGGKLHHGKPAWFGEHNTVAEGKHMWPPGNLPSFTLTAHSPACGKGMDLSKPFMLGGKIHDPLPGMKPGYFLGSAPDCGALQFGETPTRE